MEQLPLLVERCRLIQERLYLYGEQIRRSLSDLSVSSVTAQSLTRTGLEYARQFNYRESLRGWELLQEQWGADQVTRLC